MSKYIALILKVIKNEMNCILQKTPEALFSFYIFFFYLFIFYFINTVNF